MVLSSVLEVLVDQGSGVQRSGGRGGLARVMAASMLVAALVGITVLATPRPAHACVCADVPLSDYADEVDVAFTGWQVERIISESDGSTWSSDPVTLTFRVTRVYKGRAGPLIEVQTVRDGSSCGVDFAEKGVKGVAAFSRGGDEYMVSLCGSVVTIGELKEVFGEGNPPDEALTLQEEVEGMQEEVEEPGANIEDLLPDDLRQEDEMVSMQGEVSGLEEEAISLQTEVSSLKGAVSTMARVLLLAGGLVMTAGLVAFLRRKRDDPG